MKRVLVIGVLLATNSASAPANPWEVVPPTPPYKNLADEIKATSAPGQPSPLNPSCSGMIANAPEMIFPRHCSTYGRRELPLSRMSALGRKRTLSVGPAEVVFSAGAVSKALSCGQRFSATAPPFGNRLGDRRNRKHCDG